MSSIVKFLNVEYIVTNLEALFEKAICVTLPKPNDVSILFIKGLGGDYMVHIMVHDVVICRPFRETIEELKRDLPGILANVFICKICNAPTKQTDMCERCIAKNCISVPGECSICYELLNMQVPVILGCKHVFHVSCLKQCVKNTCPLCRREFCHPDCGEEGCFYEMLDDLADDEDYDDDNDYVDEDSTS
jgi:hypothetical protein